MSTRENIRLIARTPSIKHEGLDGGGGGGGSGIHYSLKI